MIDTDVHSMMSSFSDNRDNWDTIDIEFDSEGIEALTEYTALDELHRFLPRDMFVTQIIHDYASSETDLERIRLKYFEHLKRVHANFPFGNDAEIKRRVHTRSGEPVTFKLAQDIHTIIDVAEGGDISELKPLLSASRGRKSSVSVNARARHTVEVNGQNQPCTCGTELVALKGVICDIQADLVMLKQSYHASERIRSEETVCTRSTITAMTNCIKNCATTVTKHASDSNTAIGSLTSSLMSNIIQLEDRIRLL